MRAHLKSMLELQDSMNTKVNDKWRDQNFAWYRAIWVECAELMDHFGWKWWKKQETDIGNVKVELVDILHFFVSMCTVAGMNANDVMALYFKKNKLNHKRQDGGYKEGTYQKVVDGVEDNVRDVTNG